MKDFFAAIGSGDKQRLLALVVEDIEWIIPGEDWPLAGTHRGHAGLADVLQKASEEVETTYPKPPEFVAQGDRVLVVGVATGKIKATNKTFEDHWVFDITVRNGKLTNIREYIDTQALAQASETAAGPGLTQRAVSSRQSESADLCECMIANVRFHYLGAHDLFYPAVDVLIVGGIVRDLVVDRRVNKVYRYGFTAIIVLQTCATYLQRANPSWWQAATHVILGV